ncbi:MAG: hypothetical protein GY910_11785 [bacterium]|nr:hypothetical protein [Deltaproteobacteria bacterium]MCP4905650.1 hypothetical protein [bacterium]
MALMWTFSAFSEIPPCTFLVAQHMPAGFTRSFAPFTVREAHGGEPLEMGTVLIAPGGRHLELKTRGTRAVTRIEVRPRSIASFSAPPSKLVKICSRSPRICSS